jgi:hypothetical protein
MVERLQRVLAAIDAANQEDPRSSGLDGQSYPETWLYGQRMSAWLSKRAPEATERLQIAARGQHIRRWEIPRSDYSSDRQGYLRWRTTLYRFHADQLAPLMQREGYLEEDIEAVRVLVEKRGLKTNEETQILEDVICLVFLQFYFDDFLKQHARDKVVDIVRKTWAKMSETGHRFALALTFSEDALAIVKEALAA